MPMSSWVGDLIFETIKAILEWMWEERGILRYLAALIGIILAGFLIGYVATH